MNGFGELLKQWRATRRVSQLALAHEAEVSARHISFLETGRARPSREMVLVLASALDIPLRERNGMLAAAGFAAVYAESEGASPSWAPVRRAIDAILQRQEPCPAVVMNRQWDVVRSNEAATRFFGWLLGAVDEPPNVLRMMFHPERLRPWVANWDEVAPALIRRVHREALAGVLDEPTRALLAEILTWVPPRWRMLDPDAPLSPLVPVHFRKDGVSLRFFSTVTTLGTPQDITLQELRIECFFPEDEQTEARMASLAG
jgi:transcriptional regulator with XRE-family HTH domain